ncbi:MAG: ATPase [Acidobacteria bacterium]|nr:ATPase [Acidobacteriota bacterium]
MRIAIPLQDGVLSAHFGRCQAYAFIDANSDTKTLARQTVITSPPHEPGALPVWIAEHGADVVITGGMGPRAIELFERHGVEVVLGAPSDEPGKVAESFLRGELTTTGSICDHDA